MICWLQFDLYIKIPDTCSPKSLYRHHGVRIYDNSKQEECSHLVPASLVCSKSVIECLLHFLLNIPRNIRDAFFCHNLRLHKLKNCGIALFVSCARLQCHIC